MSVTRSEKIQGISGGDSIERKMEMEGPASCWDEILQPPHPYRSPVQILMYQPRALKIPHLEAFLSVKVVMQKAIDSMVKCRVPNSL